MSNTNNQTAKHTPEGELTNEQIARVFAMYLGQHLLMSDEPYYYTRKLDVQIIDGKSIDIHEAVTYGKKLLLTPLSSTSDEHLEEISQIMGCEKHLTYQFITDFFILLGNDEMPFDESGITWNMLSVFYVTQYLIQKGYAVPLFIEPNHPLNGKTAIELGLAITKATGGTL